MTTIHFVYAVPYPDCNRRALRVLREYGSATEKLSFLPKWYRNGWLPRLPEPLNAPGSITRHLYGFFKSHVRTRLYDWQEKGEIEFAAQDIIIGHPHPDPNTIIQKALRSSRHCRLKALIFPMHHAITSVNQYALPLLDNAGIILGIMGRYWFDSLEGSMFDAWRDKITRLDMAVDTKEYPYLKDSFNKPGSRGYLYIGNNAPGKGCEILGETMEKLPPAFRRGWIGPGDEIKGVPRIAQFRRLEPEAVRSLAKEYDFFVNTSTSDANPTTILEAMAWGFPVACTPQSGYYEMPSLVSLSTTDIEWNVEKLTELQYASEGALLRLTNTNRRLVETEHTWDRFCSQVWQAIEPYV